MCRVGGAGHRCPSSISRAAGGSRPSRGKIAREVRAMEFDVYDRLFIELVGSPQKTTDEDFIKEHGTDKVDVTHYREDDLPRDIMDPIYKDAHDVSRVGAELAQERGFSGKIRPSEIVSKIREDRGKLSASELKRVTLGAKVIVAEIGRSAEDHAIHSTNLKESGDMPVNFKVLDHIVFEPEFNYLADESHLPPEAGKDKDYMFGRAQALDAVSELTKSASFLTPNLTVAKLDKQLAKFPTPSDNFRVIAGFTSALNDLRHNIAYEMSAEDLADTKQGITTRSEAPSVPFKRTLAGRKDIVSYAPHFREGQKARVLFDDDRVLDGVVKVKGTGKNRVVSLENEDSGHHTDIYSNVYNNLTPHGVSEIGIIDQK